MTAAWGDSALALVSLIVTTKNSERTLAACLDSARRQDHSPIEIIVVDNRSTDATPQIAHRLADLVIDAGPERSAQRNAGVRAARGEYVMILDADMVLEPDVVSAAVDAAQTGAMAVAIPEASFGEGFWSACKVFERSFYGDDALVSAARFFPRDRVLALGGYDESLTGPEDWDLSMRAAGADGVAFAAARILHDEGRQTLRDLYLKKYYYGRSMPAFVRKHGVEALKRINPLRASLLRGAGRMLAHPVLAGGMAIMKSTELFGGLFGMLGAAPVTSDSVYRSRTS
jgi:glycosyltransferase involved in cell wall biosynthesis